MLSRSHGELHDVSRHSLFVHRFVFCHTHTLMYEAVFFPDECLHRCLVLK